MNFKILSKQTIQKVETNCKAVRGNRRRTFTYGYVTKDGMMTNQLFVMNINYFLGDAAKAAFEKLRKRYNKKRKDVKDSSRSGVSKKEVEKAQRALQPYSFLFWLDNFIHIREGRTNLNELSQSTVREASSDDENEEDKDPLPFSDSEVSENVDETDIDESLSSAIISPEPKTKPSRVSQKRKAPLKPKEKNETTKKSAKSQYLDDMEISLIRDLGKSIKNEPKQKELDGVDLYVRSLAVDLRKLSEHDYLMAKHEIQGVVFKYQMAQFDQQRALPFIEPNNSNNNNGTQPSGYYTHLLNN